MIKNKRKKKKKHIKKDISIVADTLNCSLDSLLDIDLNVSLKQIFGVCPIELIHLLIEGGRI